MMPRKAKSDERTLIEEQVIKAWDLTTDRDRKYIAHMWCVNRDVDLSDYVSKTSLPRVALVVCSLIDTEHPLLVSPGRGVMWSAMGCAVIVLAVHIMGVVPSSLECYQLVSRLTQARVMASLDITEELDALKKVVHRVCG